MKRPAGSRITWTKGRYQNFLEGKLRYEAYGSVQVCEEDRRQNELRYLNWFCRSRVLFLVDWNHYQNVPCQRCFRNRKIHRFPLLGNARFLFIVYVSAFRNWKNPLYREAIQKKAVEVR